MIETQYNAKVRVLRSDNGGEYHSSDFQKYLEGHDILHQTTCSNTPQQNGVVERKNRHLLEVVHASLIAAKIPISYWREAITSVAYLINRVPSSSIDFPTPLQALTNIVVVPTVTNPPPHVFGCMAFVHLHKHQRTKLTSRALHRVFVGYALHKKGYRCYHPPTRRMFITMDVVFHEDSMYFLFESELQGEYHKEIRTLDYDYHISKENESGQSELVNQEADAFIEIPNQSSSAEGVLNLEPDPFMKRLPHRHNRVELSIYRYRCLNRTSTGPRPIKESPRPGREGYWEREKVFNLPRSKNETWELVECPPGKKPVGCRWIYTVKYKTDGSIERFKARLVAKGYTQIYGIDYIETFALVAKINTVRALLSLVANLDWPLQQFDVKNAFLHGELSEEVYMDLPPGCMVLEKQCQKVCKLKKSLYGLKQSPRAWFGRFTKSMRAFGYCQIIGNDPEERKALQNYISREFEMKYLGPLKYFLGIEVSRSKGLKLCVEPNQVSTDKGRYQRLVGRLMYLAHIRPDLAYALSVAIQYMHNLGEHYMNAIMCILSAVDDRRSTSGYFTFVSGNPVTWKSKKQNVIARSSAKAKFRGMALGLFACDIAHNPIQHDRIKHVEVDRFFIKEKLDDKIVELSKIRSEDQLVDILTKAVSSQVFSKFLDKLGICDSYAPT
ncbi:Retrovirus-related Pol polyprotein from transposon TNT 1-94 [Vitis vinifera]|uniref:Retrovirus-related Pol polyprotein from transposon TNT 1-94 n=1 Tax=Vitis vinifera TaxID=29760 RepID=A0A438IUI1_VITVI|nr:Retrovirus-related Pol polyprotein from transposon TNT 1-94 [Vitis vinifera]